MAISLVLLNDLRGSGFSGNFFNSYLVCRGLNLMDLIFIFAGLVGWYLGMYMIFRYIKKGIDGSEARPVKSDCSRGHSWKEFETFKDSGLVYLRCIDCNKTLTEVLKD